MTNQPTSYTTRVKVIPEPILIKVHLLFIPFAARTISRQEHIIFLSKKKKEGILSFKKSTTTKKQCK